MAVVGHHVALRLSAPCVQLPGPNLGANLFSSGPRSDRLWLIHTSGLCCPFMCLTQSFEDTGMRGLHGDMCFCEGADLLLTNGLEPLSSPALYWES